MRRPSAQALLVMVCVTAFPVSAQPELQALQRGQPREVARYLERAAGCNHWAGEEAYDANRKAEIDKAISDLRCTSLERDEKRLHHRYAGAPKILHALKMVHDLYD